jgi:sirohydrochlorin ferrochelatase
VRSRDGHPGTYRFPVPTNQRGGPAAEPVAEAESQLVVAAHGTRSTAGLATLAELADRLRAARPGPAVRLCYLDVLEPSLQTTLDGVHGPSIVVPALLSTGYHVTQDIPQVTARHPRARVAGRLGPHPLLTNALVDRLAETGVRPNTVALVASGSSHSAAADDLAAAGADLAQRLRCRVLPLTLAADPAGRLANLAREGSVIVAPYLLAEGYFADQVRRAASGLPVAAPIGAHPGVVELIWRRYDEALAG